MKQQSNFRSKVMKYAWGIFKATRQSWRICMVKAWQLYRLYLGMKNGIVKFYYTKTDGSLRKAEGTLCGFSSTGKRITKPSYKTFAYFDTIKQSFRCFRIENLVCVCG